MEDAAFWTSAAFREALERFGLTAEQVVVTGNFDHTICDVSRDGTAGILRIGRRAHRSAGLVRGEVDFIRFLAEGGLSCARPLPSLRGELVEVIRGPEGDRPAVLFARAPGRHARRDELTPRLFETLGETLGRLHELSSRYTPARPAWRRYDWTEDSRRVLGWFPAGERRAKRAYEETVHALRALPTSREDFGLIHSDAHPGNFFIDGDRLTLFDFADCHYSWFVNDLAMAVFYAVLQAPAGTGREAFAGELLPPLLRGYRRRRPLDGSWLARLPLFLKLRELDLYALILHHAGDDYQRDPWNARYMAGRKERIEKGLPYLAMAFEAF